MNTEANPYFIVVYREYTNTLWVHRTHRRRINRLRAQRALAKKRGLAQPATKATP